MFLTSLMSSTCPAHLVLPHYTILCIFLVYN
jgi:hypothetical protein